MSHVRSRLIVAIGLILATFAVPISATASAQVTACSLASTGGTVTKTIWMGWSQGIRSYNLHVPAGLTGKTPLLIDTHGLGSNAFFQEVSTGWSQTADSKKFIVAYPAGSAWGQAWDINQGSPDTAFIRAVVGQIQSTYCVDDKRIFVEGGSLGGLMASRLACDAGDLFAAAVSTIASAPIFACNPVRPIAIGVFNGEDDPLFPASSAGVGSRDFWIGKNGCATPGTVVPNPYGTYGEVYNVCAGAGAVLFRSYRGTAHAYPSGAGLTDLKDTAWNFLMAHPLP